MSERECKLTECQGKPRCRTCLAMDARYPTSALQAVRHAIDEAIKAAEQPRTRRLGPDDAAWDDGYLNGIKACGSVVLAALASAPQASQPPQGAETVKYLKGVYEFLESTTPAGFADESFRLPPDASPALQLLLDAIQGDSRRERNEAARQDQGARSEDRGPVAAAPPQGASSLLPEPDLLVDCAQGFVQGWSLSALSGLLNALAWIDGATAATPGLTEAELGKTLAAIGKKARAALAASPPPATQEPAEPLGEVVGTHKVGFAELATVAWAKGMPPVGTKLYAAPAPQEPALKCIECGGPVEWRCPACKIRSVGYERKHGQVIGGLQHYAAPAPVSPEIAQLGESGSAVGGWRWSGA